MAGFPLWESGTSTSLKTGSHRSKSCGAVFPYGKEAVALTGLIHVAGFPYGKVVRVPVLKLALIGLNLVARFSPMGKWYEYQS